MLNTEKRMKHILFYNWDPLAGPAGGGVTAYLRELILLLIEKYEISFLNSGRKYTEDGVLRIEKRDSIFGSKVHSYEIINSPVLAPGNQSIRNIRLSLEDTSLYKLLYEFIKINGDYDIIHYHNMEGLSHKVLTLKQDFPQIRFLFSFHNYYPICSQVNLWKNDKENCHTRDFEDCYHCYHNANYDLTRFRFCHLDIPGLKEIFVAYSDNHPDQGPTELYSQYRMTSIRYLNSYFDRLIAVSERTKDILIEAGVNKELFTVCYVGTEAANLQIGSCSTDPFKKPFHISYLGYMRRDKGFYLFLEMLEKIPDIMSEQLDVSIISRHSMDSKEEQEAIEHILRQRERYSSIDIYNGYKDMEDLQRILSGVNLGIVPPLWEDNLPRVAIEQVALGIPILTSDLGGAAELGGNNPDFMFKAGDVTDLIQHLKLIMDHREKLVGYWNRGVHLKTMEEHVEELRKIYEPRI